MSKIEQRQLWHILEYGNKDDLKEAIDLLTERLYKVGEQNGHSKGFEKGFAFKINKNNNEVNSDKTE